MIAIYVRVISILKIIVIIINIIHPLKPQTMAYKEVRQTISKKDSTCGDCKTSIKAGASCIVDPKSKEKKSIA
jgi:hypothetical protein